MFFFSLTVSSTPPFPLAGLATTKGLDEPHNVLYDAKMYLNLRGGTLPPIIACSIFKSALFGLVFYTVMPNSEPS